MNGPAIRAKVSSVIRRTHVTTRVVKFRITTVVSGNPLLGLGETRTNVDTAVDPQPVVDLVTVEEVAASGSTLQLGDYRIVFDGTVAEITLATAEILYGGDVLKIISYEPVAIANTTVAWQVVARTVKGSVVGATPAPSPIVAWSEFGIEI